MQARQHALARVEIAYAYSGVDGVAIKALTGAGAQGIVGAGLGSGSAPRAFLERGFAVADNLAPRKARILLMLGLATRRDARDIQRLMLTY